MNTISSFVTQQTEQIESKSKSKNVTENGTPIVMPGEEASKDLFLKLLVAQMKHQDPFNPQDPTQYITQLSQFTTMEQIMSLNSNMGYLTSLTDGLLINSAMSGAAALIGKEVEVYKPEDKVDKEEDKVEGETEDSTVEGNDGVDGETEEGSGETGSTTKDTMKGTVESVEIKDGIIYMNIKDSSTGNIVAVEYAALIKVEGNNK